MSNCKIFRNKDKSINKVMDEFGNESQLYQDTLFHVSTLVDNIPLTPPIKHYLDKGDIMDTSVSEVALGLWAYSYSKHFRDKYNITKSNLEEVSVDDIIRHIEEYYPKPVTTTPTVIPEQRVTDEMLNSIESINATENTIRDLAARMADRIGMFVKFESDKTKDYKGKIEHNTAVINLANATLDTPIHEILGHPIIRAIKNKEKLNLSHSDSKIINGKFFVNNKEITKDEFFDLHKKLENNNFKISQLYQNLLKELETGRGKEVLDRIKKDYEYKKIGIQNELIVKKEIRLSNNVEKDFYKIVDKNNQFLYIPDLPSEFYNSEKEAYDVIKTLSSKIPYTLEEQQEEAIVELLGLYTANRLDSVKDGKLISLLKRLLKEIKSFIRQLLNQKEIEIDKLPDNMTISDLANILAYSNSKLILPGNEVTYTTPDNEQFKTYAEASNHISELAKNIEEVDLSNVDVYLSNRLKDLGLNYDFSDLEKVSSFVDLRTGTKIYKEIDNWVVDLEEETEFYNENGYYPTKIIDDIEAVYLYNEYKEYEEAIKNNSSTDIVLPISLEDLKKQSSSNFIKQFIERNKEYEQSKEIIEEWKKVNNIVYNPEEVYSRGQGFYHAVGAYEGLELELLLQNLVNNLEIVEKAGGSYNVSAFTKPIGNTIEHLEKSAINFVIYPQSEDILHAASTDTYTGSMVDVKGNYAINFFNVKGEKELYPIMFSKYPILRNIDKIQPNLANIIDNLSHHHNELGITLRGNNFRVELNRKKLNNAYTVYDDSKYYNIKKIVDNINSILDQKYGKLVKPEIKKLKKLTIQEENELENLKKLKTESLKTSLPDFLSPSDLFSKKDQDRLNELQQGELVTKYIVASLDPADNITYKTFETEEDAISYKEYLETNSPYLDSDIIIKKLPSGVQPTQTEDTLVESIDSIKYKVTNEYKLTSEPITKEQYDNAVKESLAKSNDIIGDFTEDGEIYYVDVTDTLRYRKDSTGYYAEKADKISKEYTGQALINTKIAKLKEVAKKYPRSLIRSEVKPINTSQYTSLFNEADDLPFQKVPTYNPETKSKTELLDEFNKLIEVSEKMGTKYPDDAINKIKSFLQDLNFKLSTVKEILDKRGLNDNPKAVIDFAYNTIAFGDGATVEDFAEEIGHLIALHAPQDKNLDRALEAIKDTQLYKDNYLNYVKTYSKPGLALEMTPERKAALEVLGRFYGKMLTGTLKEKDMKISKLSVFKRIMNFIRRQINKTDNFNLRNYLESNRDNFFLEPGKEIKSKEIFYSLEQSENITYEKMFSAIQRMSDTLKSKMSREIKDTSAPLGEYSKRIANLKTQLGLVYQMKENLAYDSAVADFLKSLYVDTTNVFSFLEKYFVVTKETKAIQLRDIKFNTQDKIIVGSTVIQNNESAVIYDQIEILRLKDDADLSTLHYSQLSELREFLTHYNSFINELGIDNLDNKLENIDKLQDLKSLFKYANDSLKSIESAVNLLNRKKMPDAIDELIEETGADVPDDIVAALKDTTIKGDLGMMEYLMGTTRDSSQPILRLFNATVKNIMHIAKRNTLSFAGKFLDKLNHRIGQSMDWAYEKYNGKFTGYLLSEYNYGWFKEEKEKFFKDINAKYKFPEDAYARTREINNIVTRHNNMFVTENEISELSMKIFNEGSTPELIEKIESLNKKLEQLETDYSRVLEYRKEISDWYKDNTTSIDNVDDIIQSVINDPELTSTEKTVWYTNNVLLNDDGDVLAYINELSQPSGKYINPDYKKLSSIDLEDLNYIKKTKEELDKFLPTKLNKLAPQTYQSTIDTFMKTQLPELVDRLKFLGKSTVTKQEDDDFGELTGDKISYEDETRIIKYNPTRYTRLLKEPNNISTDLLSSMIAYAKMVSEFKEKAERIEQIEFIAQNIKSGLTVNTDTNVTSATNTSNLIKQLENYLRVQIMGITYPDITITGTNINLTKLLKNFARFTSSKNLGLNFVTQAVDGITSTIWYNVEKVMGDTVTRKSSTLGYKVFKELVQDSIKETSSTIKNNKLSAILRTLGLSDNLHSIFNDLDKNILMRDAGNKALYAGYRASNFFISGNAALSGMHNFRLYNGKWYTEREFSKIENPTEQFDSLPSAYDKMRVENGLMIIDDMSTKTLNLFTRRMNNLISKIDGKLSAEDKTYAHNTLIGIITLIHRDWILDGISRRLKKKGFNYDTNAVDEGYWRTTGRFMKDFFMEKEKIRNLKFLVDNYNALSDMEKEGVRRTMSEIIVAVGFITIAILLNIGDDDDDRELDYVRDMLAYLATRTTVELTAFYNPFEYIYAATDVFVIGRDLKRIISFTEMFDAREIESGKWEGWTRSQKYFLQNIPGVNGTLSGANPEASNRFIINNVLGFSGGLNKLKYYDLPLIGSMTEEELNEIERDKR